MTFEVIGPEAESFLNWQGLTDALEAGHRMPAAEIGDTFLYRGPDTLLTRSAWIDGLGIAVKSATIYPDNATRGASTINGAVNLYTDATGELEAIVDFHLVTKYKTAGDSLLAARKLARPDSRDILLVGAGNVARSMVSAYSSLFPDARFQIWNRSAASAEAMVADIPGLSITTDLETAVGQADIIATATMATAPLIRGAWLRPGTHLDLIGAYRPDMREVDDEAMKRGRVFVDSRATTIGHIGEIMAPLESGAITKDDVLADFYDMASGTFTRRTEDEITIAKNGGGAHLDLMTARYILAAWRNR